MKRKLRLDSNDLQVEAFPVVKAAEPQRGTVHGQQSSLGGDCPSESWSGPVNCFCCADTGMETGCCHTHPIEC